MATAHEVAVITNSCVKAPVNPETGLLTTQGDRHELSLSATWQGQLKERDFDKENKPYSQTSKSVNFDTSDYLGPDLARLSDDEFYQRLVTLKEEHKKTLQLCEQLYSDKLSQLKDASPLSKSKSGRYSGSNVPTVSVSRDFSMSPDRSSHSKNKSDQRSSMSYKDHMQDLSTSKPPTGRPKTAPSMDNWMNANGTPISAGEAELFQTANGRQDWSFEEQFHDTLNDSKHSAHSKISDMWENFSVDEYAPHTKPRPRSASLSKMTSSRKKESEKNLTEKKEWRHKITIPKPFNMTLRDANKAPVKTKAMIELEEQREKKLREAESECEMKFKARAVPAHVYMPLYDEINEEKESRRRCIKEHCEEVLNSQVKPFKFTKREELKKNQSRKLKTGSLTEYDKQKKENNFKANPYPAHIFDDTVTNKIKEEEEYRKIRVQMRSEELLKSASLPPNMASRGQDYVDGKSRQKLFAERAKKAGFTPDHKFKPSINNDMPDFDELHRKYMKEVAEQKSRREATVCKPFAMRSERLGKERVGQRHKVYDDIEHDREAMKTNQYGILQPYRSSFRPHSANRLSSTRVLSTSMDAIPARVTKATELRASANKQKLQQQIQNELLELESSRKKRSKEERLKKSINEKAMANDRTATISKDRNAKLREYKESDRAKHLEYKSQLNAMKERVDSRPLLFERTAQENAMKAAKKKYQDTLQRAGLDEDFVNAKGKVANGSIRSGGLSEGHLSDDDDSYMKSYSNKQSSSKHTVSKPYSDEYEKSDGDRTKSGDEFEDEYA